MHSNVFTYDVAGNAFQPPSRINTIYFLLRKWLTHTHTFIQNHTTPPPPPPTPQLTGTLTFTLINMNFCRYRLHNCIYEKQLYLGAKIKKWFQVFWVIFKVPAPRKTILILSPYPHPWKIPGDAQTIHPFVQNFLFYLHFEF